MPKRVQRRRTKGWRMPAGVVNCARPSKWGNRYRLGDRCPDPRSDEMVLVRDAAHAVELFRVWMELAIAQHPAIMRATLAELRGRDLACWCAPDQICHVDVLLELANR